MASKARGSRKRTRSDHQTAEYQPEKKVKHRFSEPWDYSDLILVVEDEKFHVHRGILSMNSPVFKTMFKSRFKEATSNEIPLPEKKANEVLDFLRHIYYQHIREPVEITMENVEYLLKLSDEYQVNLISEPCIKFVENEPKTKENVMKFRNMAKMYDLDEVYQACEDLLKDMKLTTLSETVHLEDLDRENLQYFLEQRIKRLETFLDTLYPQFMGMVECLFWLMNESEKSVRWCAQHVDSAGKLMHRLVIDDQEIRECPRCIQMINSVVRETYENRWYKRVHYYGGTPRSHHFDESLPSVINEFCKLKRG